MKFRDIKRNLVRLQCADTKKPNSETLQAFREVEEGQYTEFSLEEFKKSLNINSQ